jgi:dolichyl-phosphate-mannose-protein mannosyltransferase
VICGELPQWRWTSVPLTVALHSHANYPLFMDAPQSREKDPLRWIIAIALFFLAIACHRLDIPSSIYFDEVHYVVAARKMLQALSANPEHPPLGKEIIAAGLMLVGDRPLGWRIPSALFGAFGLFAFGRMVWWVSGRRFATLAAMYLLGTGFAWFVQSRIAMLDMFTAALGMAALWQFAAALRLPARRARWRLALTGVLLGLALGAKWSVAPIAMLPGLLFLVLRLRDHGLNPFVRSETRPVPGVSLVEAALWLGILPLIVYWATYLPTFYYTDRPVSPLGPIEHHRYMLELQDSVKKPHPYRSVWYQWVGNWRAIWYLYEEVDGAQRGVLLIGNPFTMLAGLPALLWCLWASVRYHRVDTLAFSVLYLASLGLWVVSSKPVQFYYHYLLPGAFLMACLALALDALWRSGGKWRALSAASLATAGAMFIWFYPIISAAKLHDGKRSYIHWMWLRSWR